MVVSRFVCRLVLPLSLLSTLGAAPASATVLIRKSLDQLTLANETVVHGRVQEVHSYWNDDHSLILTDVRIHPTQVLKGDGTGDVVFTVLGGSVDDVTVLVLGGPELVPGSEYVLFLARADVPGAIGRLTMPDLAQGAFSIERGRAWSQALDEPLLPDDTGSLEPAGGRDGLVLGEFLNRIRAMGTR